MLIEIKNGIANLIGMIVVKWESRDRSKAGPAPWLMATTAFKLDLLSAKDTLKERIILSMTKTGDCVCVSYFMQRECRWQRDVGTRTRQEGKARSRVWLLRSNNRDKSWRAWGESSPHLEKHTCENRRQRVRSAAQALRQHIILVNFLNAQNKILVISYKLHL